MPNRPLPPAWVEHLFSRLAVVYGHAFLGRWSGLDLDAVKRSWGEELAGFADYPNALKHGLDSLPVGEPPTVLGFRELCRAALRDERQPPVPELPAPPADPAKVAALMAQVDRGNVRHPRAWIGVLRAQKAQGKILSAAQRDALKWADENDGAADPMPMGEFVPIPVELLPPGMRPGASR